MIGTKKRIKKAILAMWLGATATALLFSACHHVEKQWVPIEQVQANHALTGFDSCDDVESYAKTAATQLMLAAVEATHNEMSSWGSEQNLDAGDSEGSSDADGDADGVPTETGDEGEYSETNNQEQGVDEADLVKTDGDYIYVLHKGELILIQAGSEGNMNEAGRAEVGGYATEMFINDDVAVVFSTMQESQVPEELRYETIETGDGDVECWDYWCYTHPYSQMAVVDISDKSNPEVLRTIMYAGQYSTSRMVGDVVRAVFFSPVPALQMVWDWDNYPYKESQVDDWCNDQITLNEARFAEAGLDDIIPNKLDSAVGSIEPVIECDELLGPGTPEGIGVTTIVSIDVNSPADDTNEIAVFGNQGLVYASTESIYLTTARDYVIGAFGSGLWGEETSGVHKFDISGSTVDSDYLATGSVPGRMLDQFCLGEYEGYLRVATTTGNEWNSDTLENHVSVLQENGPALRTIGHLGGLGMGEEIYAARFMGDRGFMVTYYESDPLYTLDMSDPTNPQAIGEWHGPGYSTYLHPVGEDHLLSIGLEDWQVAISLYDVSDFSDPTLVEREYLSDYSYESAAVWDHKAFMFKADDNLLVLPYSSWESYDSGLLLYNVDASGIDQTGSMLMAPESLEYEGSATRSLWIGDSLYGVSRCRVTSTPFSTPGTITDSQQLYTGSYCDDSFWGDYGSGGVGVDEEGW